MPDFEKRMKAEAGEVIDNIVKDDYVEAEQHVKTAIAHNIASRITKQCSEIRKQELEASI